ncbi:MAG: hypothetical protein HY823_12855 [Acidobacteria bacterium]|nr:hypothetical protein [Acidobacteriota bacterium]
MHSARFTTLVMVLALPASSQEAFEAALTIDQVQSRTQTLRVSPMAQVTFEPKGNSAVGLTFAWYPWKVGGGQLGPSLAYRFKGSSDLWVSESGATGTPGTFKNEHFDAGFRWTWRKPFDLGIGLQYRLEKLAWEPTAGPAATWSTHWGRPWFEASAGYTWESPAIKPFVALSAALPLIQESAPVLAAEPESVAPSAREQLIRSAGPRLELAFRAGIRF